MLIDSHAHIFPFLGSAAGFPSADEHMRFLQFYMVGHGQPVRRVDNDETLPDQGLLASQPGEPPRLADVGFHVEANGRFVWKHARVGVDVYIHFMPPSLQTNAAPADFILTQMAYAGVDRVVLQNAHLYGRLDEYFAAALARYPDKFIGLAEVDEVNADSETELRDLRTGVRDLGLTGIYYANRGFFVCDHKYAFDHPRYDVFWETVRDLGIPVFWELAGVPVPSEETYLREVSRLNDWATRFPTVPSILTHGVGVSYLQGNTPEPLERLFANEQFSIEILYPIGWGRTNEYPYPELQPVIRELYRRMGASRLVWGSDMPNVERYCTYRQSLDYLRRYSDVIPGSDMDLILGDNLAALFGLG